MLFSLGGKLKLCTIAIGDVQGGPVYPSASWFPDMVPEKKRNPIIIYSDFSLKFIFLFLQKEHQMKWYAWSTFNVCFSWKELRARLSGGQQANTDCGWPCDAKDLIEYYRIDQMLAWLPLLPDPVTKSEPSLPTSLCAGPQVRCCSKNARLPSRSAYIVPIRLAKSFSVTLHLSSSVLIHLHIAAYVSSFSSPSSIPDGPFWFLLPGFRNHRPSALAGVELSLL